MKNFTLILIACFMFLNSFGLKTELDENLFSTITQPTTERLIKISLAKSKNKQVTEWYTQKFMGNIIIFDSNMNQNLQNCFLKNFQKIASNPVGRALLFRILIEVQKVNNDTKLKQIKIKKQPKLGFGFNEEKSLLYFDEINTKPCVIKKQKHIFKETTYKLTEETTDNIDINIFHEMCHWFHALSNPKRKQIEGNERITENEAIVKESSANVLDSSIGKLYWGNINNFAAYDNRIPNNIYTESCDACILFGEQASTISFEEMRTIYGSCHAVEDYREGDDLCENLYRKSLKTYLRFGHKSKDINIMEEYIPNNIVIRRVLNTTKKNYTAYKN